MRNPRSPGLDMGLLFGVLALLVVGLLAIYSASHVTDGTGKVVRQLVWAVLGIAGAGIIIRVDYRIWTRYWRFLLFWTIIALILTLCIARPINGARSWIDLGAMRLQPSEFAKLILIVSFAALLSRFGPRLQRLAYFTRSILFIAFPTLLILTQPDFGTAMVLCTIWLVMVLVAGADWRMVTAVCLAGVLVFCAAWAIPFSQGQTLIKDYQKQRLDFIHADPAGNGYHQRQAKIAIGAGKIWGQGYLHGTQAQRGFLPEQDTDFIFAVIGEEFGLVGGLFVLALYLFVILRLLRICAEAESVFGRLMLAGIATLIAVHVIINIGMCLSLSPVTGIPLPFISYGGSSLFTDLLAIGVALNISRHRQVQREWVTTNELIRL